MTALLESLWRRGPALARVAIVVATVASPVSAFATTQVRRWGAFGKQGEQPAPTPVMGIEGEVVKIDAGNGSSYALTAAGAVWAWGPNEYGQLGDGVTAPSFDEAVRVRFPAGVKIVAIGEARATGFAIDSAGHAWAWGEGAHGSDCLGKHAEDLDTPQQIPGLSAVAAVQGGATHSVWLLRDGAVMACGLNKEGELGTGRIGGISATPTQVQGLAGVVEVSAGQGVSCARTTAGAVYDWGDDEQGQVGDGSLGTAVATPFRVPLPEAAKQISCGGNLPKNGSTLVLLQEGAVYGWGADEAGQLGDEQTVDKASPVPAVVTAGLGLTQVVASGECALGLSANGDVYTWGSNLRHALGDPLKLKVSLTPVLVDTGAVEVSSTAYDSADLG